MRDSAVDRADVGSFRVAIPSRRTLCNTTAAASSTTADVNFVSTDPSSVGSPTDDRNSVKRTAPQSGVGLALRPHPGDDTECA
jgi:hypothetical protein